MHSELVTTLCAFLREPSLHPSSAISIEKGVFASSTNSLGYQVDCTSATIRPKDRTIKKLFFVLFSFDCSDPQQLALCQCLSSLLNMYSHVIRGMRPFVAAVAQESTIIIVESNRPCLPCSRLICGGLPLFFSSPTERVSPSRYYGCCTGKWFPMPAHGVLRLVCTTSSLVS